MSAYIYIYIYVCVYICIYIYIHTPNDTAYCYRRSTKASCRLATDKQVHQRYSKAATELQAVGLCIIFGSCQELLVAWCVDVLHMSSSALTNAGRHGAAHGSAPPSGAKQSHTAAEIKPAARPASHSALQALLLNEARKYLGIPCNLR